MGRPIGQRGAIYSWVNPTHSANDVLARPIHQSVCHQDTSDTDSRQRSTYRVSARSYSERQLVSLATKLVLFYMQLNIEVEKWQDLQL